MELKHSKIFNKWTHMQRGICRILWMAGNLVYFLWLQIPWGSSYYFKDISEMFYTSAKYFWNIYCQTTNCITYWTLFCRPKHESFSHSYCPTVKCTTVPREQKQYLRCHVLVLLPAAGQHRPHCQRQSKKIRQPFWLSAVKSRNLWRNSMSLAV